MEMEKELELLFFFTNVVAKTDNYFSVGYIERRNRKTKTNMIF